VVDVKLGLATELSCLAVSVGALHFHTTRRDSESPENSVAMRITLAHAGLYFLPVYTYVAPPPLTAHDLPLTTATDPLPNLEQQGVPLIRAEGVDLSFAFVPPYRRAPMVINALQLAISPISIQANLTHSITFVDYLNT
jgi:hypothetical protein